MVDDKSSRRSYDDPCGAARALDLIGERWALLIVRELVFGPKRFTDLRRGLPAVSQNVLSHRLGELDAAGVVHRFRLGPPASAWGYELTARGRELEPVLFHLARWGSRAPVTSTADLSVDALMFALLTTFDPQADTRLTAEYDLRIGGDRFRAEVNDGRLALTRATADRPDALLVTDPATLRALVFGGQMLDEAQSAGTAQVEGDKEAVARFLRLFPRPGVGGGTDIR